MYEKRNVIIYLNKGVKAPRGVTPLHHGKTRFIVIGGNSERVEKELMKYCRYTEVYYHFDGITYINIYGNTHKGKATEADKQAVREAVDLMFEDDNIKAIQKQNELTQFLRVG